MPDVGARQLLDSVWEPSMKPFGEGRRQRRDDDLVVKLGIPHVDDRGDRIRVADTPIDLESVLAQDTQAPQRASRARPVARPWPE